MENNRHLRTSKKDFQTGKISGGSGPQLPEYVGFIAQEDVGEFLPVLATGRIANSNQITTRNKLIGITIANTLTGFAGKAKGFGEIKNPGWTWNIGDNIFLNGTTLSTIPPTVGYNQFVGVATAPDTIDVKIESSILL